MGLSQAEQRGFFDIGVELDAMLERARIQGRKILIGIDEITRAPECVAFASEFGKWLRAGYAVYLVCTGLYENIEQLYNVKNLTFFRRATTVMTSPLPVVQMAEMYQNQLKMPEEEALSYAKSTKGYAYAFQELGKLLFQKHTADIEDVIEQLKADLYSYAYEKIWEELSEGDRSLVRLLLEKEEYEHQEVVAVMEQPKTYAVHRDRLMKRGVLARQHDHISLSLPFFNEYVAEYGG